MKINIKSLSIIALSSITLGLSSPAIINAQITGDSAEFQEGATVVSEYLADEEITVEQLAKAFRGYESGEVPLERLGTYVGMPHLDAKLDALMGTEPAQRFKTREGVMEFVKSPEGQEFITNLEAQIAEDSKDAIEQTLQTTGQPSSELDLGATTTLAIHDESQEGSADIGETVAMQSSSTSYLWYALPILLALGVGMVGGRYYLNRQDEVFEAPDTKPKQPRETVETTLDKRDIDRYTNVGEDDVFF